jgi:hypothetical protein
MAEVNLNNFSSAGNALNQTDQRRNDEGELLFKEYDYRGIFTPGRTEVDSVNKGLAYQQDMQGNEILRNIFRLEDYFWYPENFSLYLVDQDLYNNVDDLLKGAPKAGTGQIGMTIAEGRQTLAKSVKKIEDTFGMAKGTINNITGNKLEKAIGEETGEGVVSQKENLFRNISHIKITEFQPQQEIGAFLNNMKMVYDVMDSLFSSKGDASRLEKLKGVFSNEGLENIIDELTGSKEGDPDYIKKVIRIPNFFYENMIGGTYTAQYWVPYFEQGNYLNAIKKYEATISW